jgi:hypothetical protein
MGGPTSGRRGGQATVEGCRSLVLSVDRVMQGYTKALRRYPLLTPSDDQPLSLPWNTLRWTGSGDREAGAEVELRLELRANDGTAWLRYDIEHVTQKTGPQDYSVSMIATPCRFGGQRWWWICPTTLKRVANLYLPNGGDRFLSRSAYRLSYASQRQAPTGRMHDRSRKLYVKLGANYRGLSWERPPKPKGMHWRTYESICARLEVESNGLDTGLARVVERLTRGS